MTRNRLLLVFIDLLFQHWIAVFLSFCCVTYSVRFSLCCCRLSVESCKQFSWCSDNFRTEAPRRCWVQKFKV